MTGLNSGCVICFEYLLDSPIKDSNFIVPACSYRIIILSSSIRVLDELSAKVCSLNIGSWKVDLARARAIIQLLIISLA